MKEAGGITALLMNWSEVIISDYEQSEQIEMDCYHYQSSIPIIFQNVGGGQGGWKSASKWNKPPYNE